MDLPKRKPTRLRGYDYSSAGAYFLTICVKDRKQLFQLSFYDHIIRSEKDYQKIWEYIDTNIIRWENDCYFND